MTRPVDIRISRLALAGKTPAEARAFLRAVEQALAAQLASNPLPATRQPAMSRLADLQAAPQPRAVAMALHKLVTK